MKYFLKKHYMMFVFIGLILLVSVLFNSKNSNFSSVASILTAQQLISQNRGQLNNLSEKEKLDLIKQIDVESNSIAGDHNTLNRELYALKADKDKLSLEIQKINSDSTSINTQISAQTIRLNALKVNLQKINGNYRDKNKQCSTLKATALKNCRNQLKNISNSLNNVKSQITQTQTTINTLAQKLTPFRSSINEVNSKITLLNSQISVKDSEFRKVDNLLKSLSDFRRDVVNSTSKPDEPKPIPGCTDGQAKNWNSSATEDDGSCEYKEDKEGCTDSAAKNYDSEATINDGSCNYYDSCLCDAMAEGGEEKEVEKVTKVNVKVTWFGGSNDPNMRSDEPLFVPGEMARDLNPDDDYTAWPMPDVNKDNPDSPLKLPNMEECFGPETDSWTGERIARANEAMSEDYDAEISYTDENGVKRTIVVPIKDRGPKDATRWDMSKGALRKLGLEKQMNDGPEKSGPVELEVRLVPKNGGVCPLDD